MPGTLFYTLAIAAIVGGGGPRFAREVRPILSDKCFKCHGPDAAQRKKDFRLDDPEVARPKRAEIARRTGSSDPKVRMPPPDSGLELSAGEIETLRLWVEAGAEYEPHWAFVPPERPSEPRVARSGWPRNAIDAFVLARLEEEGLSPSEEAPREALLRRATLDLTGLPPTPEESDAFLADSSPGAYDRAVDRLLASPRFGERLAVPWLDAARYADTHGYQVDAVRAMWRWRDWVIDAFNRNLPFDEFTVEQIAGDLLPGATLDQKIATGFNRNHRINGEGGSLPEEFLVEYVADRAETTAAVWLGLTMACARCHDHKFDPIPQTEYYRFFALFHNVPELGVDGRDDAFGNAPPAIPAPTPEQSKRLAGLDRAIAVVEAEMDAYRPDLDAAQAEWEREEAAALGAWTPLPPGTATSEGGATFERLADGSLLASGENPKHDAFVIEAALPDGPVTGLRLEALPHDSLGGKGPGRTGHGNFVLTNLRAAIVSADGAAETPLAFASASATHSQERYAVAGAIDGDPENTGWAVAKRYGEAHAAAFALGIPARGARVRVTLEFRSKPNHQHALGRFRLSTTAAADPHRLLRLPEGVLDAVLTPAARRSPGEIALLRDHYRTRVSPALADLRGRRDALLAERSEIERSVTTVMVMQEMEKPRETFVLSRGVYDRPGEKVRPGLPSFLPALPPGAPTDRLGLALWLVSKENPLTARVAVNRFWQMIFGTGLVRTAENMGSQSEFPSHPDLLDWLAVEFMESGWDVKALLKLIMTSATYRQSSAARRELLERDPENRLLARGPRLRLPAETIRDQALAASGLLVGTIGGPPVKPYQPKGLWEEMAYGPGVNIYEEEKGAGLWRRSLYTFWRRTVHPPTVSTFDGPGREICSVRRSTTNTPLQALALMNDVTYVEAARALAARMMRVGGDGDASRLERGMRLLLARAPWPEEAAILLDGLERRREAYRRDEAAAAALLSIGASPRDESIPLREHAAWTTVASVLLNMDETITKE